MKNKGGIGGIGLWQFLRYCIVGGMNTVVTIVVIFLCKSALDVDPYLSNLLGYMAGIVNSFVWNKGWVFNSSNSVGGDAIRFAAGCGLCYLLQLAFVWGTTTLSPLGAMTWQLPSMPFFGNSPFILSGYGVATIIGMGIYTISNFLYNRHFTFTSR